MRTYLVATAAITGFYPGLVLAQSVNPSGMSMPHFQVESLMTTNMGQAGAQPFILPLKAMQHTAPAESPGVKPELTADKSAAPPK